MAVSSSQSDRWEEFDIDPGGAEAWKAIGFGPFEAALAYGDGFAPGFAATYHHQLHQVADSWVRRGLDTAEGLRWHRAGFTADEADRYRGSGVELAVARANR